MENGKPRNNLPYLQGGPPRALRVYLGVEMVMNIILSSVIAIGAVILLFQGGWTYVFYGAMMVYSAVLSVKVFTGVNKLLRGDCRGATEIESALHNRRVLIWITLALNGILTLINALSVIRYAPSGYFFGILLGIGATVLCVLPLIFYYKNIERIMGYYVYREASTGELDASFSKEGHLTALCITFAALFLVLATVLQFGRSSITRQYYQYTNYLSLGVLLLYLGAARYLLVNACYHGFLRSHTDRFHEVDPAGYSEASVLGVIGSVLFGWRAFSSFFSFYNDIISYRGISFNAFIPVIECGCFILFALAMTRRNRQTVLPVIGSFVMAVFGVVSMLVGGMSFSYLYTAVLSVCNCLEIVLWVTIGIACLIRMKGETVPQPLRIAQIILAVLCVVPRVIAYLITYQGRMAYDWPGASYYVINNILFLIALLALSLWRTEKSAPVSGDTISGKETLPESVGEGLTEGQ